MKQRKHTSTNKNQPNKLYVYNRLIKYIKPYNSLFFFIILLMTLIPFGFYISQQNTYRFMRFSIQKALIKNENPIILNKITNFKWDKLYIFSPYTSKSDILEALNFQWEGVNKINIEMTDGMCLLVFVQNRTVVKAFEFNRKYGDFVPLVQANPYSPNDAIFYVYLDHNRRIVLKPIQGVGGR